MASTLRSRIVGDELRLERGVGAAGAAAQAVVVGVAQSVRRREHGAHRAVRLLHVAEVARVLHDHGRVRCRERRAAGWAASHSEKSRTRAENACRFGRAEQAAVVLHRRTASGAVDDDRRVAGHRRDDATREAGRASVHPARVDVQRAAAVATLRREAGVRRPRPA